MNIDLNLAITLAMLTLQAMQTYFAWSTWYKTIYCGENRKK